jgi:hypothetical protein
LTSTSWAVGGFSLLQFCELSTNANLLNYNSIEHRSPLSILFYEEWLFPSNRKMLMILTSPSHTILSLLCVHLTLQNKSLKYICTMNIMQSVKMVVMLSMLIKEHWVGKKNSVVWTLFRAGGSRKMKT